MADVETLVIQLQAEVEDAQNAFQSFASRMEAQFAELESSVNEHFDGVKAKATETADHLTKEGKRAGDGFRTGIEVAIGALGLTLILSLRRAFDEGMRMTEQFKTLSAITGDSAPKLMQLQYALNQLGIPAENVRTILTMLEAHIGRAAIASNQGVGPLHALGVSFKELQNKDAITQLEILSDRFQQLGPQAQKAGAQMLFGFRGEVFLPLLQQGREGIERLLAAFKPPPDAVFSSFERLNMDLQALHATFLAFSMSAIEPIVDGFARAAEAATRFINKLRDLPETALLSGLVVTLVAAAVGFENLASLIGSFLVQSAMIRGLIVILESLVVPLRILAVVIAAVAAMWTTNFGNIRGTVTGLWTVIVQFAAYVMKALQPIWAIIVAMLAPAFHMLSVAVMQFGTELVKMVQAILMNGIALTLLKTAALIFVGVAYLLIGVLIVILDTLSLLALAVRAVADLLGYVFAKAAQGSEDALAHLLKSFSEFAEKVPWLGQSVANSMLAMSVAIQRSAKISGETADRAKKDLADIGKMHGVVGLPGGGWHIHGAAVTGTEPSGPAGLKPDEPKAKDTTSTWLTALKDRLLPFDDALDQTVTKIDILSDRIKIIGEQDTWTKVAKAMGFVQEQAKLLKTEYAEQEAKLKELHEIHAAIQAKISAGGLAQKDLNDYVKAEFENSKEINAARKAGYDILVKQADNLREQYDIYKKFQDSVIGDRLKTYAEKMGAYSNLSVAPGASQFEKDAATIGYIDTALEAAKANKAVADSDADLLLEQAKAATETSKMAGATNRDAATVHAAQLTVVADQEKLAASIAYEKQVHDELIPTIQKYGAESIEAITLQSELNNAEKDVVTQTQALTVANQALYDAQNSVTKSLQTEFGKLVDQLGGPVTTALRGLVNLMQGNFTDAATNLAQAFIVIFQKTLAYKDIEVAIMEVTTALAKVLNILRPIIDLLIGILIGVVNVFISMYDVIATILDMFGLMITKIKLLNSDLQNMNVVAQPLIKIIHDLPTLPEFNRGYWTQLIGEQDAMNNNINNLNSDILTGFDKTVSKLGEILGILIAIKFLLGMFGVNLLGSNQSWISAVIGWVQRMFGGGGVTVPLSTWENTPGTGNLISAAGTGAGASMSDAIYVTDQTQTSLLQEAYNQLQAINTSTSTAADTATQTTNNAVSHTAATIGVLGKVVGGIASLYGVVSGYMEGGPMGGISAGLGAAGLMSLLAPAFAAGPYGIAAAAAIGLGAMLFGGHFGPNPANEPDVYQTSAWGQMNANLWGAGVGQFSNMPMMAAGQAFSMSSALAQATGGMGLLQFIAAFMQSGSGLNVLGPRLATLFAGLSTTSTDIIGGKNGILDLMNGVQMNWQQLYTSSYQAFQLIQKYMNGATAGALQFTNAMNINLAEVYGPHTAARAGPGGAMPLPGPGPIAMTVNFNGNNYGYNSDEVYNQLKPVFNQLLLEYQQQQALYTRSAPFAFSRGLSYT